MKPIEWIKKPHSTKMTPRVLEAISRRRRQMLIHSCIYYVLNENIISDETWSQWATQLLKLQLRYGHRIGFYDRAFADWNGSTGHHLPVDVNVERVARRMLALHKAGVDILVSKKTLKAK